jgi:drug/metabolite transporter (DMT)-like permease
MKGMTLPIVFAVATAIFWGMYGPALGNARSSAHPPEWSAFKPYVFIGLAYLIFGCLGGMGGMAMFKDSFSFTGKYSPAATWGFVAGTLGALGALTLTFAMVKAKGNAALVMPIVFGGATTVSAIVGVLKLRGTAEINPLLWVGMALVIGGLVLVARFTPHPHPAKPSAEKQATVQAAEQPAATPSESSG